MGNSLAQFSEQRETKWILRIIWEKRKRKKLKEQHNHYIPLKSGTFKF